MIQQILVELDAATAARLERAGLPRTCVANAAAPRSTDRSLLGDRLGALAPARHHEAKRALEYAFDWAELKNLA